VNMPNPYSGAAGPSRTGSGGSSGSPIAALVGGVHGGDARRVQGERVEPATEGREAKAQTILAESQRRGVELLVIGQRRVSSFLGYVRYVLCARERVWHGTHVV
jgi:hypothetical protein